MIVRSSLDLAVRRQLLDRNVAHATHARRRCPTGVRPRSWTAQELALFLKAARSQRLYPALHLAAFTGMRRGEVVGLKWFRPRQVDQPAVDLPDVAERRR
jgi:integrase